MQEHEKKSPIIFTKQGAWLGLLAYLALVVIIILFL